MTARAAAPGESVLRYVMSDNTVHRSGNQIDPAGWQLDNFKANPVALFNHNGDLPIGKWTDVSVEKGRLVGTLDLLEPTTSFLRHIHTAVKAGVLRAVSVGWLPLEVKSRKGEDGVIFTKSELVEASIVSVPDNPNALAIASALGLPRDAMHLIFGGLAETDRSQRRGFTGGLAEAHSVRRAKPMTPTERIEAAQNSVNALRDQLSDHMERLGDEPDDSGLAITDELQDRINTELRKLATFQAAEAALGQTAEPVRHVPSTAMTVIPPSRPAQAPVAAAGLPRPFAMPRKQEAPGELFGNVLTCRFIAKARGVPVEQVMAENGHADNVQMRALVDFQQRAAAVVPATTTGAGWADALAHTETAGYIDALLINSIYRPLAARGVSVELGRNAQITMPMDSPTPTVSGSFVAEAGAIPVRAASFTSFTIGLKKMAVIVTFTREIFEHSQPAIDPLLRDKIQRDTGVSLDTILIDANAATTIRPAGLRFGVAGLTPTAGGGFNALVADIKQLMSVLITANSLRAPTWIMNPQQALSISMMQSSAGTGVFPFKAEIDNNVLAGYPVIVSATVTPGLVILVDAADFVTVSGADFRFDLNDSATLHMEDTAPVAIGTPGSPAVVAAPTRSLFQTDSIGLRMILPMNFAMRRTGLVAWMTGVTW
jgi:HK97 family phage major capsid protein/HK97 family phage prohead protease